VCTESQCWVVEGRVGDTKVGQLSRIGSALALALTTVAGTASAGELGGSLASMKHQHDIAVQLRYTFLRTPAQVREYAATGRLEVLHGNTDYALASVSFPYARAEVRMFVEHLAADYRTATGNQLVVTSLTRPEALQPRNAHELSVHPAGMAVDFRVPDDAASRKWLESRLVSMEKRGLLDVTRERRPPHYHVAVFPAPYRAYAKKRDAADAVAAATRATTLAAAVTPVTLPGVLPASRAQLEMPINPLLGGAATGLLTLALLAAGGQLAAARRKRRRR
jgi:hypothetical protein